MPYRSLNISQLEMLNTIKAYKGRNVYVLRPGGTLDSTAVHSLPREASTLTTQECYSNYS